MFSRTRPVNTLDKAVVLELALESDRHQSIAKSHGSVTGQTG